jgi:hypothetical protein
VILPIGVCVVIAIKLPSGIPLLPYRTIFDLDMAQSRGERNF